MLKGHSPIGREFISRRVMPLWGAPSEPHADRGTHFTGQMVKIGPVTQHFHCAYHPQSSGLAERTKGTIKPNWLR